MDLPPVPGDLLVDIFLRLADPADLVRASAACVSFRRLVADRSFLRQYRMLHAPPLLGFLVARDFFQPAIAPHPSAPAASAVALAADFSYAFLPSPSSWLIKDVRDGRVLLYSIRLKKGIAFTFIDLVVCDPLHRQYLLLPPIPDEVFTSVEEWHAFLVPPAEEAAEETAFRVTWMARCGDKLVAFVFSSTTGQWQAGPWHSWSDSFSGFLSQTGNVTLSLPQHAYGCFYWVTGCREKLLVLDTGRMEFSITDAPSEAKDSDYMIVEAGESRPGMFVIQDDTPDLNFIVRRNSGGSSGHWQLEKTISLGFRYYFTGSRGGMLFLEHNENFFSLEVNSFQLETVSVPASKYKSRMFWSHPYSNFAPSLLSSPTVATGVVLGTEEVTPEQGCEASSSAQSP